MILTCNYVASPYICIVVAGSQRPAALITALLQHKTIRSILAPCMLVLFAFGITPKQCLHDLFAGHTDRSVQHNPHGGVQLSSFAFSCDTHSAVVHLPFAVPSVGVCAEIVQQYIVCDTRFEARLRSATLSFQSLRAPPALA